MHGHPQYAAFLPALVQTDDTFAKDHPQQRLAPARFFPVGTAAPQQRLAPARLFPEGTAAPQQRLAPARFFPVGTAAPQQRLVQVAQTCLKIMN